MSGKHRHGYELFGSSAQDLIGATEDKTVSSQRFASRMSTMCSRWCRVVSVSGRLMEELVLLKQRKCVDRARLWPVLLGYREKNGLGMMQEVRNSSFKQAFG